MDNKSSEVARPPSSFSSGGEMAKATVYIETTIVSYLTSRRSHDLIISAHQKQTHDWWNTQRCYFELNTSEVVVLEASGGNPTQAAKRIAELKQLPLLNVS